MTPLVGALARVPKAIGAGLGQLGELFSGAKTNEAAKRQAATELERLIDASWELLAGSSSEWKQGRINYETITALEQYAAALDTWYKEHTLLFHKQPDLLEHVNRYMMFLHHTASHLVELHNADKKYRLIARLNVCEMRLELARAEIHSYIAARLGIGEDQSPVEN
jgi:hypothetical protein